MNLKGVTEVQQSGPIIPISSVVAVYENIGQADYAANKAGVIGMVKSWAKEFAFKGGNVYDPTSEGGVPWNDPTIAVD